MNIPPTFTITLSLNQASAIILAISTCQHLSKKSINSGLGYGLTGQQLERLADVLQKIDAAIPQPSPTQTNEPCNTQPQTS